MIDLFKDLIPSILQTKRDLTKEDGFDKVYSPFVVNKALSFHYDCVLQANSVNLYPNMPKDAQYLFLLNSIRGYRRPYRWIKKETIADLETVKEYYGYSNEKAKDALRLLSNKQVDELRKRLDKGGK